MKFIFTGDVALGDHPKTVGFGFGSRYNSGIPLGRAETLFPAGLDADVRFANLEFSLDEKTSGTTCCRGIPQFAEFLSHARFDILNVANNHIYQYGLGAFTQTINNLHRLGIHTCGTPDDISGRNAITVNGESVCFLGWSDRPRQYSTEMPPYNEFALPDCYDHVRSASARFDIVCVSLHWGDEFIQIPKNEERMIARNLIDHGATLIIGHHPHVIREVEEYNGGLIAYSLGNFIGDMLWDEKTRQSAALFVEVKQRKIKTWRLLPAIIGEDYFPTYLDNTSANIFTTELASAYEILEKELRKSSYDALARKALRRHQVLTLAHFFGNLRKYPRRFALETIVSAFKDRLDALQSKGFLSR